MTRAHQRLGVISLVLVIGGVLLFTAYRFLFGVDVGDEAYYVAVAYRFARGDIPYRDEILLGQGGLIIPSFFVRAFYFLNGSLEGVVLYTRALYYLFALSICGTVFYCLKEEVGKAASSLMALTCLVFIPFAIPNFGYNTVGGGLFTAGLFLLFKRSRETKSIALVVFAGVSFAFSVMAHPIFIVAASLALGISLFHSKRKKEDCLAFLFGFLGTILFLSLYFGFSLSDFVEAFRLTHAFNVTRSNNVGFAKIPSLLWASWNFVPHKKLVCVGFVVFFFLYRKWKKPSLIVFSVALPLIAFRVGDFDSHRMLYFLGFFAPLLLLFLKNREAYRKWLVFLWFPSLCAGLAVGLSSTNGAATSSEGFIAAVLVAMVFSSVLLRELKAPQGITVLPALFLVLPLVFAEFTSVYNDEQFPKMDVRVKSGPFKGLFTSQEKIDYLNELSMELRKVKNPQGRIVFYEHFPAGYLLTEMLPAVPNLWGCHGLPGKVFSDYYLSKHDVHNVAVHVKNVFYHKARMQSFDANPILDATIRAKLRVVSDQKNYTILVGGR